MAGNMVRNLRKLRERAAILFLGPVALACLPAFCLATYWIGGETALMVCAIAVPVVYLILGGADARRFDPKLARAVSRGLMPRDTFRDFVGYTFSSTGESGSKSAIYMVEIDEHDVLEKTYGHAAAEEVTAVVGDRIVSILRDNDAVTLTGAYRFAACLEAVPNLDLETCIQLAGRLQEAVEEPVSVDGTAIYVTATIGFCQHARVAGKDALSWMEGADLALVEARDNGPASIRAFSADMSRKSDTRSELREEVVKALEEDQIRPWFQPQISTDTGRVTGFEALARWHHPKRGMIPPGEFLPAIEQAGQLERLAEVMLHHAFRALRAWDDLEVTVPQIGVNFAGPELNNPNLVQKVQWELDCFGLAPDRLAVEVLETVVASSPDDMVSRNINGLSKMGCKIDLDDFGTGHASIASIRRFAVSRIKIDRSFVMKSDRDPDQQRMISAILTMAERLGVETLAEGVESSGEHALLSQLGCDHVQGFGIGKPMPFDQTVAWIESHNARLQDPPRIMGDRSG
ncbi:bifunctional diguanylate cyclase/phosphodiesterase [uncultured Roseobacter sp.]|uniref:putative bifunctional diguanylate cyclase/phosphodiesterase n=1 Tax=uncultured Roseobacter sp. TaxID=114847 RepID=UPI002622FBBB|nr:GGDEF domain-containing phosphodiesterase [uncultured Roseobacter sp.]